MKNINDYDDFKLFMLCLREASDDFIKQSGLDESNKSIISKFILHKSSDYQLLSLLFNNKLIREKYNYSEYKVLSEIMFYHIKDNNINLIEKYDDKFYSFFMNKKYNTVDKLRDVTFDIQQVESKLKAVEKTDSVFKNINAGTLLKKIKDLKTEKSDLETQIVNYDKAMKAMRFKGLTTDAFIGISAILAVAMVVYTAYKVYKNYLSKAARACKGKTGREKEICISKYKLEGMKKQLNELKKGLSGCSKTKDPNKCKNGIQKKIVKLVDKIKKEEVKI